MSMSYSLEGTLFWSTVALGVLAYWNASAIGSFFYLKEKGYRFSGALLRSIFLGPFLCIPLFFSKSTKLFSKSAFLIGFFVFILSRLAVWFILKEGMDAQEVALLSGFVGAVVAGLSMSLCVSRIGFMEGLFVAALFCVLRMVLWKAGATDFLFEFGTPPVYIVVFFLGSYFLELLGLVLGGSIGFLLFGEGKSNYSFQYEGWIATRFLMGKKESDAISFITLISIFAVMVGCCGMVVVMGVMNGFSYDLKSKILGSNAHVLVLKYGKDFSDYEKVMDKIKSTKGIIGASPIVLNEVMISSEVNLSGAILKGIDARTIGDVSLLPQNMVEGDLNFLKYPEKITQTYPPKGLYLRNQPLEKLPKKEALLPAIVVGKEMAQALRVFVGDVINVVSPIGEIGPLGPIPKAKAFRVGGIFYSGMYEFDAKFAYIDLYEAQNFFGFGDSITGIECRIANIEKTKLIVHEIALKLKNESYYTKDWMQMNHNLFSALRLEKVAMFIILMVLIFMASLLILVALVMVVLEKGKEIAILKSMGATQVSIMKIFVTYGLIIGTSGAALGVFLGILACLALQFFGIGLDPEVHYIAHLPIRMEPFEIGAVFICAVLVSFLATIPPALQAASLKPVDGLKTS